MTEMLEKKMKNKKKREKRRRKKMKRKKRKKMRRTWRRQKEWIEARIWLSKLEKWLWSSSF